jgi:hypothetical protein
VLTRRRKKVAILLILVLLGAAGLAMHQIHDPERAYIEVAFYGYMGDLKMARADSAALRVFPDDLLKLKNAALETFAANDEFRSALMEFFRTKDPATVMSQPRERFFEFLIERTMEAHPEVLMTLSEGSVIGLEIARDGDNARVTATIKFVHEKTVGWRLMRLRMALQDEEWWIRL